jgi:hypothetical protein
MTLSMRNRLLGAGIAASIIPATILAVTAADAFGTAPLASQEAIRRARGILQIVAVLFLPQSPYAPLASMVFSVLYAGTTIALIYYFFEKTQAPEILFFALFALSLACESFRIAVPLAAAHNWPPAYVVSSARSLLFGRFFGLFALFAAGLYATGLEYQKHGRVVILVAAAAFAVAAGAPVDGLSWDSAYSPLPGYASMLEIVQIGVAVIAIANFLVAAYSRGSIDFVYVALGCVLVVIGRDGLIRADTWLALPLGAAAISLGTALVATKVHRFYLWL